MKQNFDLRMYLLLEVKKFVDRASLLPSVHRIALIGSLTTVKTNPKDADVLVTIDMNIELDILAMIGRKLKGAGQMKNSGADIFLCDKNGNYLGRTCSYRECHPRMACLGNSCNQGNFLNNDFDDITLDCELIKSPPIELWPQIIRRVAVPADVESLLLKPLER